MSEFLFDTYFALRHKAFNIGFLENQPRGLSSEISEKILSKNIFDNAKIKIANEISNQFKAVLFKEFLSHPQINNLLIDCIRYSYYCSLPYEKKIDKSVLDDGCNFCVGIIESFYPQLATNDEIILFRKFWEILMMVPPMQFHQKSQIAGLKDYDYEVYFKSPITTLINKLRTELRQQYVPERKDYEKIRFQYQKLMGKLYQNGFIYLLGEYKFNEFYIPPIMQAGQDSKMLFWQFNNVDWRNIFCQEDIVYVVGGPGSGKSLFLRNIINNYQNLSICNSQDYLLIYCDLKTYYTNNTSTKKSMVAFMRESIIKTTGLDENSISEDFIKYYIEIGRCIVLLDALDEVPKEKRNELHKMAVSYFSIMNPNNKVCITSRDRGFIPQDSIEVFHISSLTNQDINNYIEKLITLKKFKKEDKETFMMQAQVLINKHFLCSFLVLSLLVSIYKAEKELPENKIDLYKKCFEYIAKKREEEKSKSHYDWENINPLMKDSTFISISTLAIPNNADIKKEEIEKLLLEQYKFKYVDETKAERAISEFLEFCSDRTELLVPAASDDKFKFFHRSFFEYFYSRYIFQKSTVKEMYDLMIQFDIDSEVFELTVALVKDDNEKKYQDLINYIFDQIEQDFKKANPDYIAFGVLSLAMQVIDDAFFLNRYFEIVITYSKLMQSKNVSNMNQKLISLWLHKTMSQDNEKKMLFKKTYENINILYVLKMFDSMIEGKRSILQLNSSDFSKTISDSEMATLYRMRRHEMMLETVPFYIKAYEEFFDLIKLLNSWDENTFSRFIFALAKPKEKKKARSGYAKFKSIGEEEQQKLWTIIINYPLIPEY